MSQWMTTTSGKTIGRTWSDKTDMEEKIQRELEIYGFTKGMLTAEELKKLEEEILLKEQGYFILEGILESIPVYSMERNLRMKK